ncbi:MAG: RagB/SusD family nutrient uptake outer membrane protein, partial [Paramuribaculum sp.]|nr:RagB/SusD family nutrient uptake outer membrane protein [Paramuribaculum sp.]
MNKILTTIAAVGLIVTLPSCIQEFEPQSGSVTANQAANAPGSYNNFVNAITANISGKFVFTSTRQANDFGYTSMYLRRDVMGNDMVAIGNNWFSTWYQCGVGLAPIYLNCQYPWTFYYVGIKSCNTGLRLAGEEPNANMIHGAGIAHT